MNKTRLVSTNLFSVGAVSNRAYGANLVFGRRGFQPRLRGEPLNFTPHKDEKYRHEQDEVS